MNDENETTEEKTRNIVLTTFWTLLKIAMGLFLAFFVIVSILFVLAAS